MPCSSSVVVEHRLMGNGFEGCLVTRPVRVYIYRFSSTGGYSISWMRSGGAGGNAHAYVTRDLITYI